MALTSFADFPEELLERILAFAVVASPTLSPRAQWYPSPNEQNSQATQAHRQIRTRTAILLVCRAFHRIALPFFYNAIVLRTFSQSHCLSATLGARPSLARCVRTLVLLAPSSADAEILTLVGSTLRVLDVTLPPTLPDDSFAQALARPLPALCALSVRKAPATYLSQPAPRAVLHALADAVSGSPLLEHTTMTFPLSADPALAPLVAALALAPALHTLRTPLPAVWAPALLTVSANPALTQICLGDEPPPPNTAPKLHPARANSHRTPAAHARPILGTALFLAAARKHARLAELIQTGTPVVGWRGRAQTVSDTVALERKAGSQRGSCYC